MDESKFRHLETGLKIITLLSVLISVNGYFILSQYIAVVGDKLAYTPNPSEYLRIGLSETSMKVVIPTAAMLILFASILRNYETPSHHPVPLFKKLNVNEKIIEKIELFYLHVGNKKVISLLTILLILTLLYVDITKRSRYALQTMTFGREFDIKPLLSVELEDGEKTCLRFIFRLDNFSFYYSLVNDNIVAIKSDKIVSYQEQKIELTEAEIKKVIENREVVVSLVIESYKLERSFYWLNYWFVSQFDLSKADMEVERYITSWSEDTIIYYAKNIALAKQCRSQYLD